MNYDVLLFDLDDTLFDFRESEKNALFNTFQGVGLPNGVTDYRTSYNAISKVLWDDLEQGRTTLQELKSERFKRLFLEHALEINAEVFGNEYLENLGKEIHVIDGVESMLAGFANCRLVVLTNGFTDVQHARIGRSIFKNSFEAIITSEETGFQKPQKEIFEYVFEKLQITDKSRVLMIGDSLSSDIQGGLNFGIDTCWYNPHHKGNTTGIQPTFEIHSWDEMDSVVKSD
ncbi:YjjG family noncanonical pyrimidine nucleotidase [Sporosarcina siberiensis]|uniref:YjjG family noncanonical pyrimidine nucleotidase n=1 Tax=Sporosarcina siberiensis TaxID=1365606 RepID=A0ABW4SCP9_9BACL